MKKMYLFLSVLSCLVFAQNVSADANDPVAPAQGSNYAWNQVDQSDIPNTQGQGHYYAPNHQQGGQDGVIVDPATAPQGWERDMGNGYTCCCTYKPCYYTTCETVCCPQYNYKKCCRYVPQYYQQTRCRYVPQYYCETCCRQVPQYYYTCECVQCPKQIYHKHCRYVPQYSYKCCPQPCCDPCPQPCDPCAG